MLPSISFSVQCKSLGLSAFKSSYRGCAIKEKFGNLESSRDNIQQALKKMLNCFLLVGRENDWIFLMHSGLNKRPWLEIMGAK